MERKKKLIKFRLDNNLINYEQTIEVETVQLFPKKKKFKPIKSFIKMGKLPDLICLNKKEYNELWNEKPEVRETFKLYGKIRKTPRFVKCYGKDYTYSGKKHPKQPTIPNILSYLLASVNKMGFGGEFNSILVNWYENGNDYISPHSDDERSIIKDSPIVCFNFGASRKFNLTEKDNKKNKLDLVLNNNTFILMGGKTQTYFKHEIPIEKNITESRISVTFRQMR